MQDLEVLANDAPSAWERVKQPLKTHSVYPLLRNKQGEKRKLGSVARYLRMDRKKTIRNFGNNGALRRHYRQNMFAYGIITTFGGELSDRQQYRLEDLLGWDRGDLSKLNVLIGTGRAAGTICIGMAVGGVGSLVGQYDLTAVSTTSQVVQVVLSGLGAFGAIWNLTYRAHNAYVKNTATMAQGLESWILNLYRVARYGGRVKAPKQSSQEISITSEEKPYKVA